MFARHGGLRHRHLDNRPDRIAGLAIEHVDHAGLVELDQRVDRPALDRDRAQHRGRGSVIVPQVVVDELPAPHQLARPGIERDDAVGPLVVARAMPAEIGKRRRGQRHIDQPERRIGRNRRPGPHVADDPRRIPRPGVVPGLAFAGNQVECPQQVPGAHIIAADVFGIAFALAPAVAITAAIDRTADPADHDHIAHNDRPGRIDIAAHRHLGRPAQVHFALVAKAGGGHPGFRIERIEELAAHRNDARIIARLPERHPARALPRGLFQRVRSGLLHPLHRPGRGIERLNIAKRIRHIEHAIGEDRRAPVVGRRGQIGKHRGDRRRHRGRGPGQFQVWQIGGRDLVKRGIALRQHRPGLVGPVPRRGNGGPANSAQQQRRSNAAHRIR